MQTGTETEAKTINRMMLKQRRMRRASLLCKLVEVTTIRKEITPMTIATIAVKRGTT